MDPVRFSRLKLMALSPAHYQYATVEETSAMERGTAVHSMLLGGARVVGYPGAVRRGKDWEAFKADNRDAVILTDSEHQKADAIVRSVQREPLAMKVLDGQREAERSWSFGQRACAGRIDALGREFVTELKCCATSEPERFRWQAMRMGYMAQLAWYLDGVTASGTGVPESAYVVAVESKAPFPVTVLRLSQRALEQGRRQYRLWFERLLACEDADKWPAYCQSVVELDVPDDTPELDFSGLEEAA